MKLTTVLLPLLALLLAACTDKQESPAPSTDAAETSGSAATPPAPQAAPAAANLAKNAGDAAQAAATGATQAASGDAQAKLKEASGFSDTISKTWDSIKGLDFAKKGEFVKQAMDLVSMAKDKIGMLQNLASSLPGGMGEKLLSQVGGLTGNITDLSGLLGKAGSIGAGDWSSYKDQIGSALSLLGGKFGGLDSLL